MGKAVSPKANLISPDKYDEFVADLARFGEGLFTEAEVKERHHFSDADWSTLREDVELIEAVTAEKLRRVRNGSASARKPSSWSSKRPPCWTAS